MSIEKDNVTREVTFKSDDLDDDDRKIRVTRERENGKTSITLWIESGIALSLDEETAEQDAFAIAALLTEAANHRCGVTPNE